MGFGDAVGASWYGRLLAIFIFITLSHCSPTLKQFVKWIPRAKKYSIIFHDQKYVAKDTIIASSNA